MFIILNIKYILLLFNTYEILCILNIYFYHGKTSKHIFTYISLVSFTLLGT